jgi:hypothetical protein
MDELSSFPPEGHSEFQLRTCVRAAYRLGLTFRPLHRAPSPTAGRSPRALPHAAPTPRPSTNDGSIKDCGWMAKETIAAVRVRRQPIQEHGTDVAHRVWKYLPRRPRPSVALCSDRSRTGTAAGKAAPGHDSPQ